MYLSGSQSSGCIPGDLPRVSDGDLNDLGLSFYTQSAARRARIFQSSTGALFAR